MFVKGLCYFYKGKSCLKKECEGMETVIGTYPREAFPPLLPPQHRNFLAPQESAPTRTSYAGNSTTGVLFVTRAQLLNVQGKGMERIKKANTL